MAFAGYANAVIRLKDQTYDRAESFFAITATASEIIYPRPVAGPSFTRTAMSAWSFSGSWLVASTSALSTFSTAGWLIILTVLSSLCNVADTDHEFRAREFASSSRQPWIRALSKIKQRASRLRSGRSYLFCLLYYASQHRLRGEDICIIMLIREGITVAVIWINIRDIYNYR
ncbi:MAG: hypothetical protein Greene071436_123 [Parcubacteria group bacterium Greene0714_36]|nr:MAG: hypothetical protein Greene071436_123 [Parcubacteria group bacterium Greene0714_36]